MTSHGSALDDVLFALADPTRRRLLEVLASCGEGTATTLATELPVSRQAVVKHLAVLDRAGLVEGHRIGREVRYQIRPYPLDVTAQWMATRAADWASRMQALKRVAESAPALAAPIPSHPGPARPRRARPGPARPGPARP